MTAATHLLHVTVWGVLLALVFAGLGVATVVDTARRPEWQWQQAGAKRSTWLALEIVFLVLFVGFGLLGLVSAVVDGFYFWVIRPKLQAADGHGPA